jgi:hypothetical protein
MNITCNFQLEQTSLHRLGRRSSCIAEWEATSNLQKRSVVRIFW